MDVNAIRDNLRARIPVLLGPCNDRYIEQFVTLAHRHGAACTGEHVSQSIQDYWRAQGARPYTVRDDGHVDGWPVHDSDRAVAKLIVDICRA